MQSQERLWGCLSDWGRWTNEESILQVHAWRSLDTAMMIPEVPVLDLVPLAKGQRKKSSVSWKAELHSASETTVSSSRRGCRRRQSSASLSTHHRRDSLASSPVPFPNKQGVHAARCDANLNSGKYLAALEEARMLLLLNPDDPLGWYYKGLCHFSLQSFRLALVAYTAAVERDDSNPLYLCARSEAHLRLYGYHSALRDADRAIDLCPSSTGGHPRAWFCRGRALSQLRLFREAKAAYNKAVQLDVCFAEAFSFRAVNSVSLNDYVAAWNDVDRALELDPLGDHGWAAKGTLYLARGEHKKALMALTEARKRNPGEAAHIVRQGLVYLRMAEWSAALAAAKNAIEVNPSLAEGWNLKGLCHGNTDQIWHAKNAFDKAIERNPNNAEYYYNRGVIYRRMEEPRMALMDVDKSLAFDLESADGWNLKGLCHADLNQFIPEARAAFDSAIRLDRNHVEFFFNRGETLLHAGDVQAALKDAETALNLNADPRPENWNLKGLCHARVGDLVEAKRAFTQAVKRTPRNPEFLLNKAQVLFELNEVERTLTCVEEVLKLDPHLRSAWHLKGLCHGRLNHRGEARAAFEEAMRKDPDNDDYFRDKIEAWKRCLSRPSTALGEMEDADDSRPMTVSVDQMEDSTCRSEIIDIMTGPLPSLRTSRF
eukprot:Protomagalhaensia_sp_Gyna_25__67@NODE_1033_length_2264_cov_176_534382_g823_i0_p1_GENE_NODE_1033_length_2264_cov_176_534382_g823_i0NODE_1033_length_2264_cov_176_534382_g823_i0_p1_ORF_typecomplete_len657_score145_05TPR_16/PF13432_6/2_3e07TPR_16/PF13432_6/6_6e07TPR_16/PF13432_6/0_00021TPR_16/PF13432_6/0_00012TPR_16/PF13432_6/8_7e06TPR_16/PF13432_6/0_0009TPR_16/PF13432_6/7_6e09TPR_16/PF13432_6/1_2e05TPR_16/PF13432_6/2e07TPR_9/PF13371_6/4_1e07TPR_9/PF13371_6/2_4TPR_9/PF13371_6/8_7e05TPR_9/PF13371_6/9